MTNFFDTINESLLDPFHSLDSASIQLNNSVPPYYTMYPTNYDQNHFIINPSYYNYSGINYSDQNNCFSSANLQRSLSTTSNSIPMIATGNFQQQLLTANEDFGVYLQTFNPNLSESIRPNHQPQPHQPPQYTQQQRSTLTAMNVEAESSRSITNTVEPIIIKSDIESPNPTPSPLKVEQQLSSEESRLSIASSSSPPPSSVPASDAVIDPMTSKSIVPSETREESNIKTTTVNENFVEGIDLNNQNQNQTQSTQLLPSFQKLASNHSTMELEARKRKIQSGKMGFSQMEQSGIQYQQQKGVSYSNCNDLYHPFLLIIDLILILELELKLHIKRERNRLAARKCRNKKLNQIEEFQKQIEILSNDIQDYQKQIEELTKRKSELRSELIRIYGLHLFNDRAQQQYQRQP